MNNANYMVRNEINKNGKIYVYNNEVTTHLNKIFKGLIKAVYVLKHPNKFDSLPSFSSDGEKLDLDGCTIWMLFVNDAMVCFSNSEWGSLEN